MWKQLPLVLLGLAICLGCCWLGQQQSQPSWTEQPSLRTETTVWSERETEANPSQMQRLLFRFFQKHQVTDDGDEHSQFHHVGDDDDDDTVEEEEEPVKARRGPPPEKVAPASISGDNRNLANVFESYQVAKERLLDRIKADYGPENFESLFMASVHDARANNETMCTIGRNIFKYGTDGGDVAWGRAVRQMKINLLQYLGDGKVQDFVWATAGNAAAAGHGNFFDEQYTMVVKDRVSDMFTNVGLDFVARPYGIGGATSAPEIAGCAKEIFGADVDMITWDFAMTDGRWYWRMEFFAHRVMMLPNRPTMLVLNSAVDPVRKKMVEHLTSQGMTVLRQDGNFGTQRMLLIPDSKGKTKEELAEYTKYVRHFKCGYGIETGKGCIEHKFTKNGTCDDRPHQTNWQRGWKWHAYQGTVYSLFLMEIMEDALHELMQDGRDYLELYRILESEAEDDFLYFEQNARLKYGIKWSLDEATAIQFYRDPTYCHTALLPAQSRYLGYVFNDERYDDWTSYYKGSTFKNLRTHPSPQMKIAYQPMTYEEKERCNDTSVTLSIDQQSFFFATDRYDGYQTITLPSDAEINAYGMHESSGLIVACAAACSNECGGRPQLSVDHVHRDAATIKVNGQPVESVERFDNCFILKTEGGGLYWPSNHEYKYEIEVEVTARNKHFEFTSFIVW